MTVLDAAFVDRVTDRARGIHFWRTVLLVLAGVLFGVGWVAAKAFGVLWLVLTWSATVVVLGWKDARKPSAPVAQ